MFAPQKGSACMIQNENHLSLIDRLLWSVCEAFNNRNPTKQHSAGCISFTSFFCFAPLHIYMPPSHHWHNYSIELPSLFTSCYYLMAAWRSKTCGTRYLLHDIRCELLSKLFNNYNMFNVYITYIPGPTSCYSSGISMCEGICVLLQHVVSTTLSTHLVSCQSSRADLK